MEILISAFQKLSDPGRNDLTEVITISGRSGTGKSTMLKELHDVVFQENGLSAIGKFDQLMSNQPYSALIAAFDEVFHYLLSQDNALVATIKDQILKSIALN